MSIFSFWGLLAIGGVYVVAAYLVMSGPSASRAVARRLEKLRERHSSSTEVAAQVQLKRILAYRGDTKMEGFAQRFIPKPALLRRRIEQTGRSWTLAQYLFASVITAAVVGG